MTDKLIIGDKTIIFCLFIERNNPIIFCLFIEHSLNTIVWFTGKWLM